MINELLKNYPKVSPQEPMADQIRKTCEKARDPQEIRGWLEKKSASMFKGWQPRYVILKDRKMKYYKSDNEHDLAIPQGVINMEQF